MFLKLNYTHGGSSWLDLSQVDFVHTQPGRGVKVVLDNGVHVDMNDSAIEKVTEAMDAEMARRHRPWWSFLFFWS